MPLGPLVKLEVRKITGKGRGVFAGEDIAAGSVIEKAPVLVVPTDTIDTSPLMDYVYCWTEKTVALALGFGSMYNHSFDPNARYDDVGQKQKVFTALRAIPAGEEITINYNGEPERRDDVGFEVK